MRHRLVIFLFLCCIGAVKGQRTMFGEEGLRNGGNANAALPKNWPWRGISVQSSNTTAKDVDYLAQIGVNFLRIQIRPSVRLKDDSGNPISAFYNELEWANEMVESCRKNGITSLLAFNHLVLGPESGITEKSVEYWNGNYYLDSTYKLIEIIVQRFKDRGDELSAYEVMGEPVILKKGQSPVVPERLEEFFKNVLKTIRKHDEMRWFLLTPGPWGRPINYEEFKPFNITDNRIIYGAHMYLPDAYTHQGVKGRPRAFSYPGKINNGYWNKERVQASFKALLEFEKKYNVPIYIGEFQAVRYAPGAIDWVKDVIETMDAHKWSWSLFAFEPRAIIWDPYYDVANPNDPPKNWILKEVGPNTPLWKHMILEYRKNK